MGIARISVPGRGVRPHLGGPVLGWLARWAESSQEGARRNAMIASTAAVARRRQREEVEAYLATARTGRTARAHQHPGLPLAR